MSGPLSGVNILDLTAVVLGPSATQYLGDLGATIIKVEPPNGDVLRSNGFHLHPHMGSVFLSVNRNKKSLAIDLRAPAARGILRRLIKDSDVLVHNMRISAAEKLGVSYEFAKTCKRDIIYCVATGYGSNGPYNGRPAFDEIIQAESGLAALSGKSRPSFIPTLIADKTAGCALSSAILAALFHHERTGEGQSVEVPMFETLVAWTLTEHLAGATFSESDRAYGYDRLLRGGRRPVRTSDGFIAILPYTEKHWAALFKEGGRGELVKKYKIDDQDYRNAHLPALYREMRRIVRAKGNAYWIQRCRELDIPVARIYELNELITHPQLGEVEMFKTAHHPSEGQIRYMRPPTMFSRTPAGVRSLAPLIGEQTEEILEGLGYAQTEIRAFEQEGVVVVPS